MNIKLSDINWNQVYYFYEVARRLSMKEASEAMGVSAPTVSEHIKNLERRLDIKLFKRRTRQIELTDEGRHLFNQAKEMFDRGIRFLDAVSPRLIGGYPAKVGILESISDELPVQFIIKYLTHFKDLGSVNTRREASHDRLENQIQKGDLDWGISIYKPKLSSLNFKAIGQSEVLFCASTKSYEHHGDKKELFSKLPLLKKSWDSKLTERIIEHLQTHGVKADEWIESEHPLFSRQLVQSGFCMALILNESLKANSWGENIKSFRLGKPLYLQFYALWPKGHGRTITIKTLLETLA